MLSHRARQERVHRIFRHLYACWGPRHWWPARTAFEIVVGAFLTQNTTWSNVEKAIARLRSARVLSVAGIRRLPLARLEELIRPAGYFRQKAARLKAFVAHLDAHHGGSLRCMMQQTTPALREELLALNGVGPETADSILLYAGNHPVFVVDAYTQRIFRRHYLSSRKTSYEEVRTLVETALKVEQIATDCANSPALRDGSPEPGTSVPGKREKEARVPQGRHNSPRPPTHPPSALSCAPRAALPQAYNEFHALLVQVAKHYCLKRAPRCNACPLRGFPHKSSN